MEEEEGGEEGEEEEEAGTVGDEKRQVRCRLGSTDFGDSINFVS